MSFETAREQIDDALGIKPNVMPMTYQMPAGAPGPFAQGPQPSASRFGGLQVGAARSVGPGQFQAGANLGPQGQFQGANANFAVPMAGGQFNVSADLSNRMKLAQLNAQYQKGNLGVNVGYRPGAGMSGGMQYRQQFQEGGLATSIPSPQDYHQRDVDFLNTRNQHMREMAGKMAYNTGGFAVK